MSLHEGDASRRLASQANDILAQLHLTNVPKPFRGDFKKFISLIDETVYDAEGRIPLRIKGIYNITAVKYIKLLVEIQEYLKREMKNEHTLKL